MIEVVYEPQTVHSLRENYFFHRMYSLWLISFAHNEDDIITYPYRGK